MMLFAAAATIAGNIVAALVIWRVIEWKKTRDWKNLLAPIGIGVWVVAGAYLAVSSDNNANRIFALMIAAGIVGALLSARAIFGIVRYTKAEAALGDDPQYTGSIPDLLAFGVVLVPVLAVAFFI
ncbi:hypothetical protein ABMA32_22365 [Mesorhizobium sp. VNQ89]|uniref:hypothetical protein n=1 Tax=Mesorhizobium quangtriensis TaxID=3157709 RepID=UPI0032B7BBED